MHCEVILFPSIISFVGSNLRLLNSLFFIKCSVFIYLSQDVFIESRYSCAQIVLDLTTGSFFKLLSLFFLVPPSFFENVFFLSNTMFQAHLGLFPQL